MVHIVRYIDAWLASDEDMTWTTDSQYSSLSKMFSLEGNRLASTAKTVERLAKLEGGVAMEPCSSFSEVSVVGLNLMCSNGILPVNERAGARVYFPITTRHALNQWTPCNAKKVDIERPIGSCLEDSPTKVILLSLISMGKYTVFQFPLPAIGKGTSIMLVLELSTTPSSRITLRPNLPWDFADDEMDL